MATFLAKHGRSAEILVIAFCLQIISLLHHDTYSPIAHTQGVSISFTSSLVIACHAGFDSNKLFSVYLLEVLD